MMFLQVLTLPFRCFEYSADLT